ncbi:hypothetical protein D3C77_543550 [compost metagenome]
MNEKGSYAHVGLPGLRELFAGGGKRMKEEREIRSILHDGTEVVFNTGDRVLFQASRPEGMPLAIDADSLVDDLILTLEQKDETITGLRKALKVARWDIKQIAKYPDDKEYIARFVTLALEQINSALGEGDKE